MCTFKDVAIKHRWAQNEILKFHQTKIRYNSNGQNNLSYEVKKNHNLNIYSTCS